MFTHSPSFLHNNRNILSMHHTHSAKYIRTKLCFL
nr:MAG TPA: hypothetical protein [Caudoviricetes sp.]